MVQNIKRRLGKLENVKDDPLAELERANPYLAKMRAAWKKTLDSPKGAAMWTELNELLGPIHLTPTGYAGIDASNSMRAMIERVYADGPHCPRLRELWRA
jgi:hypothetical protein